MIDDGLFERFPCDSIFGMHNRPKLPVGHFNVKAGPMMASAASWDIHIKGYGLMAQGQNQVLTPS